MKPVVTMVENRGNDTDRLIIPPGDEEINLGVFKKWVLAFCKGGQPLMVEPRNPMGIVFVNQPGNLEKLAKLLLGLDSLDLQVHVDNYSANKKIRLGLFYGKHFSMAGTRGANAIRCYSILTGTADYDKLNHSHQEHLP